jgi:hypothetical protein
MIEKVVNRKNMLKAYRQVVSNGGSAGVDGMSVKELSSHLRENRGRIVMAMINGKYLPQEQREETPARHSYRDGSLVTTSGPSSDRSKV